MSTTRQRRGLGVNDDPANGNDTSTTHERNLMLLDHPTALRILVALAAVLVAAMLTFLILSSPLMPSPPTPRHLIEVEPATIQEI